MPSKVILGASENRDITMEWNPRNESDVLQAKQQFDKFLAQGFTIYRLSYKDKAYVPTDKFDPNYGELLISPPVVEAPQEQKEGGK